jgi:hypothetical protein
LIPALIAGQSQGPDRPELDLKKLFDLRERGERCGKNRLNRLNLQQLSGQTRAKREIVSASAS